MNGRIVTLLVATPVARHNHCNGIWSLAKWPNTQSIARSTA